MLSMEQLKKSKVMTMYQKLKELGKRLMELWRLENQMTKLTNKHKKDKKLIHPYNRRWRTKEELNYREMKRVI